MGVVIVECKDFVLHDFERDCLKEGVFGVFAGKHFTANVFFSGVAETLLIDPRLAAENLVRGELRE